MALLEFKSRSLQPINNSPESLHNKHKFEHKHHTAVQKRYIPEIVLIIYNTFLNYSLNVSGRVDYGVDSKSAVHGMILHASNFSFLVDHRQRERKFWTPLSPSINQVHNSHQRCISPHSMVPTGRITWKWTKMCRLTEEYFDC